MNHLTAALTRAASPLFLLLSITIAGIGFAYYELTLPMGKQVLFTMLSMAGLVQLIRIELPDFLTTRNVNWPVRFVLPVCGIVIALFHRYLGLRGGIAVQTAIVVASLFVPVILTTDLILAKRNTETSLFTRLVPQSSIFLSIIIFLIFEIIGYRTYGIAIAVVILFILPIVFVMHYGKHYLVVAVVTYMLGLWPLANKIPKLPLIIAASGFLLVMIAFFRNAKAGLPVLFPAKAIYISGFLYLSWLTISASQSSLMDSRNSLKIILGICQLVFLFGMLQNLRTKQDLWAIVGGYLAGAGTIVVLMLQNAIHQITNINALELVSRGLRVSAGGEMPAFVIGPVYIAFVISFAFAIKSKGTIAKIALVYALFCVFSIFLSGTRIFMLSTFAAAYYMAYKSQKWRRIIVSGVIVFGILVALVFILHPSLANILTRAREHDSGHFYIWQVAWDTILRHPLLGSGPNASMIFVPQEFASGRAHNAFFSEAMDSGLIGAGLLFVVYCFIWKWINKIPERNGSPWKLAGLSLFLAMLIIGIPGSTGFLFIHANLGECYPPLLAMIIATGDVLPDSEDALEKLEGGST